MKKSIILLSTLLIMFLSSCDNIFNSSDGDITNAINDDGFTTTGALSFDFSNAKAIGTAIISRSIGRSNAQDAFGLVKILDDGSIEMAMDVSDNMMLPEVQFIAKSPVPGSKDLFISFSSSINYWTDGYQDDDGNWIDGEQVNLGCFLHIEEDGSYKSILPNIENGQVKNYSWYGEEDYKPITFDNNGNIYFASIEWGNSNSIEVLYKYNPTTGETTPLTVALEGYNYTKFEVSPDGSKLFVLGSRSSGSTSTDFFRMYPLDDLNNPVNIFYSSSGDTWVRGFKISPDGSYVILNGYNIRKMNGILKVDITSNSELVYNKIYDSNSNYYYPIYGDTDWGKNGLFSENNETYSWNEHWYTNQDKTTGTLDYNAIINDISSFYTTSVDFFYNGKRGEEALVNIFGNTDLYDDYNDIFGNNNDYYYFFKQYIKNSDKTDAKTIEEFKTENSIEWLDFQNVGNLFFDKDGALWGVLGGSSWSWTNEPPMPVKLLNDNGERDLEIVNAFSTGNYNPVGFIMNGNNMFFRDAVTDSFGEETGYHKLYNFDVTDSTPIPDDLLVNVPGNGHIEIVDFSIGGDYLYVTGVNGLTLVGGKINTTTKEYTPFDSTYRLSNIEVY